MKKFLNIATVLMVIVAAILVFIVNQEFVANDLILQQKITIWIKVYQFMVIVLVALRARDYAICKNKQKDKK